MCQILEDFITLIVATQEEDPNFTNQELRLFYGIIGFMIVFLAVVSVQLMQ